MRESQEGEYILKIRVSDQHQGQRDHDEDEV